jgi:ABC-type polysaccharide/polyol phosphate export permease
VTTPVWTAPGWELLWIPVIVVLQVLFTFGVVLLLSTLQVFLRDTSQFVTMFTTMWMFLTPIFWVPELIDGVQAYMPFLEANPAYPLVQAWRGALMGDLAAQIDLGVSVRDIQPVSVAAIPGHVGVFALWARGAYAAGSAFFVLTQRRFADEV